MIYLLTGPVNSGKTSWVLNDYQNFPEADGFACKKVWVGAEMTGYDLFHLKTGLTCPLIRTFNHIPPGWDETARLNDRFSFSSAGLLFARHITQNAILNNVRRFYLDEAGHLEVQGDGFHHLLEALLGADIDLVIVVRETLVERLVAAYGISEYELIRPA
ncbi:MAG TPA: nucleoside-triphosphatase [Candidatus Rifleibacterium sp.]|jgi:nucleoside-triphosphatase THEP1|nr:nucleoside-triphosphatase [Candidatus Rifleibacterium sp.]HPW59003.1 nucleoside-triphosphatase [Candidatus Rifleibacterium sp.]HQB82980.1 nucleoside-triphosphatase [Candidatus Rifleibacterium sp.]